MFERNKRGTVALRNRLTDPRVSLDLPIHSLKHQLIGQNTHSSAR